MKTFLVLVAVFAQATCSGNMKIRLKTRYTQDLTVLVSHGNQPSAIALPVRVPEEQLKLLGPFPIDFNNNYTLTILGGKIQELAINGSSFIVDFQPIRGNQSPKQLHLPLTGLELVFDCDLNYTGDKCDILSKDSIDEIAPKNFDNLNIVTDYSIDLDQMPKIVEKLKKTNEVANEITKPIEKLKQRETEEKTSVSSVEGHSSFESIVPSIFSTLLNRFAELRKNKHEDGPSTHRSTSRKHEYPWKNESNEDDSKPPSLSFSIDPSSIFKRIQMRKAVNGNDGSSEGIRKHREGQEQLGMKHSSPTKFNNPFSPLQALMDFSPFLHGMKL